MKTTVADTAATVSLDAYKVGDDGVLGASNLQAAAAIDINVLGATAKSFTIATGGFVAGDMLDCRIGLLVNDAATATAVIVQLTKILATIQTRG